MTNRTKNIITFKSKILATSIIFLAATTFVLIFEARPNQLKYILGTTLVLTSTWLLLKRKSIFSILDKIFQKHKKIEYILDFLLTITTFLCLSTTITILLPSLQTHFFDFKGQSADLLSAGALILAITTGYFLWALIRTEEQAKKLIRELKEKKTDFDKNNNFHYSTIIALTHISEIQIEAIQNIIHQKNEETKENKTFKNNLEKLKKSNILISFISKINSQERAEINHGISKIFDTYDNELSRKHEENIPIEWAYIKPLLIASAKRLKYLFPERSSYSEEVWELIEMICDDVELTPDQL